jgi:hypothetical protein
MTVRAATSFLLALVLIGVVATCTSVACPLTVTAQDSGCCHRTHHQRHNPCPSPVFDCPYLILEKGKTVLAVSQTPALSQSSLPDVRPADSVTAAVDSSRVPDSVDLFLRIRVFLI